MTTNHHTTIPFGSAGNAATFNAPLGELDQAITNVLNGAQAFTQMNLGSPVELTIASGVVTATGSNHTIDTEGDAATDDLDTISGGSEGDVLLISASNTNRTVIVKHGTGNITLSSGVDVILDDNTHYILLIYKGSVWVDINADVEQAFTIVFFQNGSTLTTGVKHDFEVPFDCRVVGWTILADASGSIVIDVWRDTYANYPPTVADTIAGSEKPTLSAAVKNQDLSLTTWTVDLNKGETLRFNIDSVATVTRITLILRVIKR